MLAPFNRGSVVGVGCRQIMRPNDLTKPPTLSEQIADSHLTARFTASSAASFFDGSVDVLSEHTMLLRADALDEAFMTAFIDPRRWSSKCVCWFTTVFYLQIDLGHRTDTVVLCDVYCYLLFGVHILFRCIILHLTRLPVVCVHQQQQ